jgi:glutamate-1-semialdehyde 2,1-aminomutase
MNFQSRLEKAIPGGAHTYSRGKDQFPSNAPALMTSGSGAYLFDAEGKSFLDFGMALRSVTLGYSNKEVNEAAFNAIQLGNNLTKPSLLELEAAEKFISIIPAVEMVKFAKNGSNVTTAAIKVARAVTGKKYVCVPRQQPFFSFDDWFIGTTPVTRGIPNEHVSNTLLFDYGDIDSLVEQFDLYPNQIAAVMLEPVTQTSPCQTHEIQDFTDISPCTRELCGETNFLYALEDLCKKQGAVFILDEMISGFRWSISGAQTYFGLDPDLTTFGKAMASGFSVAALGGKTEFMSIGNVDIEGMERTFLLSSTHGAEMSSLGAFLKVCEIYDRDKSCETLWKTGRKIRDGVSRAVDSSMVGEIVSISGPDIGLAPVFKESEKATSAELRTVFMQEMIEQGIMIPYIAQSTSHSDSDVDRASEAMEIAFLVVSKASENGTAGLLNGPAAKPVFRKYN